MHLPNKLLFLLGVFFLFSFEMEGQLQWSERQIDYGTFTKFTERVTDVIIVNTGTKTDHLLRADFSTNFQVLYSTRDVAPGDTLVIRMRFNPRKYGHFKETIPIYFASSQTPYPLEIKAEVTYVNLTEDQPCPNFNQQPTNCCGKFSLDVLVIDKQTKEPISSAEVELSEQRQVQLSAFTNRKGEYSNEIPIGYYTLYVSKQGYSSDYYTGVINLHQHRFVFELEKQKEQPVIVEVESEVEPEMIQPTESTSFNEQNYLPNNITFLLDASGSMALKEKWPTATAALGSLSGVMRSSDIISLVTYAQKPTVVVNSSKGSELENLKSVLGDKQPGGSTSGTKGFEAAYKLLKKNRIENGNNQLYVITDGAFQLEDQLQIEKLVRKAKKKQIYTTVIVIKGSKFAKDSLHNIANKGGGSFLTIDTEEEATRLLFELIKHQSKK